MSDYLPSAFAMLPTDDPKTWLLRVAHIGIWGALIGIAVVVVLLIQNAYLIYSVRKLRAEMLSLNARLKRLLVQR